MPDEATIEIAEPTEGQYQVKLLIDLDPYTRGQTISHEHAFVFLGKGLAEPVNDLAKEYCKQHGLTPERQLALLKDYKLLLSGKERLPE